MRRCLFGLLCVLGTLCFIHPSAQAADTRSEKAPTKETQDNRPVLEIFQDIGTIILDHDKQIALSFNNDGDPIVFSQGETLENVSVDTLDDTTEVLAGSYTDDDLVPQMTVQLSRTVTGKLVVQISDADGTNPQRFHVTFNSRTRALSVAATVCTCYGGVTVPKRTCLATECADPAECSTQPNQPSLAHCKELESGIVRQRINNGNIRTISDPHIITSTPGQ